MFEEVVAQTPWLFRHFPRTAILTGLKEKGCKTVTEAILIEVCKETTPDKYKEKTMAILERMKTSNIE
jgi:hypothetical protein